jgi:hypothetical protein
VIANAYVIRAGETKHGINPRWRKSQFIQAAIATIYPHILPDHLNEVHLTTRVNIRLLSDPAFTTFQKKYSRRGVSRQAVMKALEMMRRANS